METTPVKVLVIEDSPTAFLYLKKLVAEAGEAASISLEHASTLKVGLECLAAEEYDVVLLDLLLPDSRGFDALHSVHAQSPRMPVVMMSGIDDEVVAMKMVRDGAQAYLIKGEVDGPLLVYTIRNALERKRAGRSR